MVEYFPAAFSEDTLRPKDLLENLQESQECWHLSMLVFRAGCADGAVVIVVSVGNEDNGDDKLEFLYSSADEKFSLSPISDE